MIFLAQSVVAIRSACDAARAGTDAALASTASCPIPRPGKIVCLGLNYAEHAARGELHRARLSRSLSRASAPPSPALASAILRPQASELLDYEAELAVVIGKRGKHIAAADALGYIAGYTAFNDATLRDYQRRTAAMDPGQELRCHRRARPRPRHARRTPARRQRRSSVSPASMAR